jgi:hypothetical protein
MLRLKFEHRGAGLVAGAAWVVCGDLELTPDCATISELEYHVNELKAELDSVLKKARREFERTQGGRALKKQFTEQPRPIARCG